jgi:hypothetical protein
MEATDLNDTLPGLRHRDGGAPGQEDGLVAGAEWQDAGKAALDQNNLVSGERKMGQMLKRPLFSDKFILN